MQNSAIAHYNHELHATFRDSVPGLYLGANAAPLLAFGKVATLEAGSYLDTRSGPALHVLMRGQLTGEDGAYGPGNHFGAEAGALQVGPEPAALWTLDMSSPAWRTPENRPLRRALTRALIAADASETAASQRGTPECPDPRSLCDHTHPAIRRQAVRLLRATPAGTARAIFHFIQKIPYRFGAWNERASDTLAKGVGMCTTKANLQVALLRAAGLEAGFGEHQIEMRHLGILMPDAWRQQMRPRVRHFFAAVRLGGRWHITDATYTDACCDLFGSCTADLSGMLPAVFDEGRPYSPSGMARGEGGFMDAALPDLAHVMGKQSRFSQRQFEALNTRADRIQGLHHRWLRDAPAAQDEVSA